MSFRSQTWLHFCVFKSEIITVVCNKAKVLFVDTDGLKKRMGQDW